MQRNFAAATDYQKTPEMYRAEMLRGIYTRVARNLGLGKSGRAHVCRVAHGERRSPRVESALRRELARIERKVAAFIKNRERAA